MGLRLYKEISTGTYATYRASGETDDVLPIITTHDGILGEVSEIKLFLRNDDASNYYTDISIEAVCSTTPDETDGISSGHGVKLIEGSAQPTEAEWSFADYGSILYLDDIGASGAGDINTYLPFWYRVECPAGAPADNKENINLRISYTANLV